MSNGIALNFTSKPSYARKNMRRGLKLVMQFVATCGRRWLFARAGDCALHWLAGRRHCGFAPQEVRPKITL